VRGEMRLYVDGAPVESRRVSLPAVKGSLGFCCVVGLHKLNPVYPMAYYAR
jgi:hypothetical protein